MPNKNLKSKHISFTLQKRELRVRGLKNSHQIPHWCNGIYTQLVSFHALSSLNHSQDPCVFMVYLYDKPKIMTLLGQNFLLAFCAPKDNKSYFLKNIPEKLKQNFINELRCIIQMRCHIT